MAVTVCSIFLAPHKGGEMTQVQSVEAEIGKGLVGDRYYGSKHRHVTVQSVDALAEASEVFGSPIDAGLTRRNITVSVGPVPAQPGDRFTVGSVLLEVVRVAAPCSVMNAVFGDGASAALRRRAGSVCRVLNSGVIAVGDEVVFPPPVA
ncbi:MAG: MOSC domain-containing protein [Acidimicrobiales bacterium]